MNDKPDVAADTNRPEVSVPRLIQLVKAHTRVCRVQLKVKGGCFDRFLFVAGQPVEAVSERI